MMFRSFGGDPMYANGATMMPDSSGTGSGMGDQFLNDPTLQDSLFGFLNANGQ